MKRINPDLVDMYRARFVNQQYALNRFTKLWGTEYVDGVRIFTARKYYYNKHLLDESTKKFAKYVGFTETVEGAYTTNKKDYKYIESAWLCLDPSKDKTTRIDWKDGDLEKNFKTAIGPNGFTGKISIAADSKGTSVRVGNDPKNMQSVTLALAGTYNSLLKNSYEITAHVDDPFQALVLLFAIDSNSVPYEILSVKQVAYGKAIGWDVELKINPVAADASIDMIGMLKLALTNESAFGSKYRSEINRVYAKRLLSKSNLWGRSNEELDDDGDLSKLKYIPTNFATSSFWHKGKYLKTSVLKDRSMDVAEKVEFIYSLLGSDYKKKKMPAWKKILAVVIVVIAVVGAFFTAGGSLALLAPASAWAGAVAVATFVTMATLYISLAALAFSLAGAADIGLALANYAKNLEPLAKIAGIILIANVVVNAVRDAAAREATRQAGRAAGKEIAKRTLFETTVEVAKVTLSAVIELTTGVTNLSKMSFSQTAKLLNMMANQYYQYDAKKHEKRMAGLQKELDSIKEAEERNMMTDVARDLAATYANQLAVDYSAYSELYDRPFDWWSTRYHTGCMQANSVSGAWRISDEDNIINDQT